ncbi:MAG: OadG family protein [Victivallales bacterium]|nr:OadG family protein [Victivallales bacterium]
MFSSALNIMLVGMGFVFVFLGIQVIITLLAAKLGGKYAYLLPEPEKKKPAAKSTSKAADDTEVAAVIAAALKQAGKLPL